MFVFKQSESQSAAKKKATFYRDLALQAGLLFGYFAVLRCT